MSLTAFRCSNGHLYYPNHPRCPTCGTEASDPIDLTDRTGTVVTWTESTATPPGVRQPNALAIVEFAVDDDSVRVVGQLTTADVDTGDLVAPVYVEELRDPDAGIREPESQAWDGYRFEPVD
ncbi:MAG: Zn-ribbon domain-containing OB-fold protein [Halobacteriota archaeon]